MGERVLGERVEERVCCGGESISNFLTLTHVCFAEKGPRPDQSCHEGSNLSQVTVGSVPCQASSSATFSAGWTIIKRQAPSTEVSEAQGRGVWVNPGGRCGRSQAHRAQERAPTDRPWSRTPTCQQPGPSGSGARINLIQDPKPQIVQGIRCPLGSFELPRFQGLLQVTGAALSPQLPSWLWWAPILRPPGQFWASPEMTDGQVT